ncbi:MAG: ABC transporter ATP-binding protein [Deltaproteobacteria bacterium]|nr:MAG: ABC transporter ATP-binding protein [Deltaproteobacteria bacterium]
MKKRAKPAEAGGRPTVEVRLNPFLRRIRWDRLRNLYRELRPFTKPVQREMLLALLCSIGTVITVVARPWPIKMIFDYALLPAGRVKWVFPFALMKGYGAMGMVTISCALLLAITLLWAFFIYWQRFLIAVAGQRVTFRIRRKMFAHLQRLSLSFHKKRQVGDLLLRATGDANMMRDMLVDTIVMISKEMLVLAVMVGIMAYMDLQLTLVSLAILPLLGLAMFQLSARLRSAVRKHRSKEGRMAMLIGSMLQGIAVIQVFGREQYEDERFGSYNRQDLRQGLKTVRLEANLERMAELVIAIGTAGVLWLGVKRVLAGILTPGDLIVFTHYLRGMYKPLRRISWVTVRLSKATVAAERVFAVLHADDKIKVRKDARPAPKFKGRVTFKHVTFSYRKGEPVLKDVSFTVLPGQTVAIVGANGAGKSTLCGLLPRLYDPDEGSVTIDGEKINRFTLDSLREQIAVVLQQPLLFAGTIGENIAYGKPEASQEEIQEAARLAGVDELVARLPDGYDTVVGERGETLSGGERQKIAIARAMIKKPAILILDEPTAALDATSEAQINRTLERVAKDTTTFRVGHRLSELQGADLIVVIEGGRITQKGTHEELVAVPGWYRTVYELQGGVVPALEAPASAQPSSSDVAMPRAAGEEVEGRS